MKTVNRVKSIAKPIAIVLGVLSTSFTIQAHAAEASLASQSTPKSVTYKITDGYGEYVGVGSTKIAASAQAREACIIQKINAYESRTGQTPDADTADLFFDACLNK